jgi:hypothetical protein
MFLLLMMGVHGSKNDRYLTIDMMQCMWLATKSGLPIRKLNTCWVIKLVFFFQLFRRRITMLSGKIICSKYPHVKRPAYPYGLTYQNWFYWQWTYNMIFERQLTPPFNFTDLRWSTSHFYSIKRKLELDDQIAVFCDSLDIEGYFGVTPYSKYQCLCVWVPMDCSYILWVGDDSLWKYWGLCEFVHPSYRGWSLRDSSNWNCPMNRLNQIACGNGQ